MRCPLLVAFILGGGTCLLQGCSTTASPGSGGISPVVPPETVAQVVEAAKIGDVETLSRVFATGVDVDVADVDGRTALHHAVRDGELETVEFLLRAGARIDARDSERPNGATRHN